MGKWGGGIGGGGEMGGNGEKWGEWGKLGGGGKILEKWGEKGKNVETRELESQPADTQPLYGSQTTFGGM